MISLFRRFDLYFYPLRILLIFLLSICITKIFKFNYTTVFLTLSFNIVERFFSTLKIKSINKHVATIFIRTIILIFFLNFSSVYPFVFPATSQVRIVLLLSVIFWLNLIIFSLGNNIKGLLYHAIPEGSPIYLTWFLFLIEVVRNLIRPVTLMVRLTANILSGHLLIILLSKLVLITPYIGALYLGLNVVEMFVSAIQSYIFLTIVCLYYAEIN